MSEIKLLKNVQILKGVNQLVIKDDVLIKDRVLISFGKDASNDAKVLGATKINCSGMLLAPCLVDPHSVLEEPISGNIETLSSLCNAAATAGYGRLALLPRSSSWRDRPERLEGFNNLQNEVTIDLWGSFSKDGKENELTSHADLLQHGAIGIAGDDSILPLALLQRGLLLGEVGNKPILIAPRDKDIQGSGVVREGVETLRAGWKPDPIISETIPLAHLLELQNQNPKRSLRVMNISTSTSVEMIKRSAHPPMATVCWWHLIADRSSMSPTDIGWRVSPSIGGKDDREALKQGLKEETLTAISVHSIPLDEEESQLAPEMRIPGIAGHQLVLPLLWQELIIKGNWSIEQLWQALSFGPSRLLDIPQEKLSSGSRRWLLFDPDKSWVQDRKSESSPNAANQPFQNCAIKGKVIDCGLKDL